MVLVLAPACGGPKEGALSTLAGGGRGWDGGLTLTIGNFDGWIDEVVVKRGT
jgi:hypothetical protein